MTEKETNPKCEHCGKPAGSKSVQGLCPACLLKVGLGSVDGTETQYGRFDAPAPEDLADLFPQIEILELIGTGGMGAVYKARQRDLDRIVALKILAPRGKEDPSFTQRFTREARALARLSHPHIVGVHDFGHAGDLFYFVMEYVDGTNLRQVQQAGTLSSREALTIVPQICAALQFAHDQNVVHRDIKPENILLDRQGTVKIVDFGLAKVMKQPQANVTLTQEGHVMGTPHYMAPEQVEHPHDVDHRADIYSLGVVFYEMLTGELPLGKFQAPSHKVEIDVRLDEVVLKTLAKEPQRRYQHVSQVGTEVQTIVTTSETRGDPVSGEPLKSDACYISTLKHLGSFKGRFINTTQGRGTLRLEKDALVFHKGWQVVTIPFSSLQSLARGQFPLIAKPIPLHFMGVTFDERGVSRTLLFMPIKKSIARPSNFNAVVEEWFTALQAAAEHHLGREIAVESLHIPEKGFWNDTLKLLVGSLLGMLAGNLLVSILLHGMMPDSWKAGMISAVIGAGLLTVIMTCIRLHSSRSGWKKSARPLPPKQRDTESAGPMQGFEYRSPWTLWGLPLLHITQGLDPETGRTRLAQGVIAIGDRARGIVAFGGVAVGVLACGGLAVGGFAVGGGALGIVAVGGLAVAALVALGGGAVGWIALGGGAVGRYAYGGGVMGRYLLSYRVKDPVAQAFFEPWAPALMNQLPLIMIWGVGLCLLVGVGVALAVRLFRQVRIDGRVRWNRSLVVSLLVVVSMAIVFLPMLGRVGQWPSRGLAPDTSMQDAMPGFTQTHEVLLRTGPELKNSFLDLETRRVLDFPPDKAAAHRERGELFQGNIHVLRLQGWLRENEVDVVFRPAGLILFGGVAILAEEVHEERHAFETLTAEHVVETGRHLRDTMDQRPAAENEPLFMGLHREGETYIVQTAAGRAGVLQVLELDKPAGRTRIRYKLVEEDTSASASSVAPEAADADAGAGVMTDAAAPRQSKLAFRILPRSADHNGSVDEETEAHYRRALQAQGPGFGETQSEYLWILSSGANLLPSCIRDSYQGRTYVLASNQPDQTLLPDGSWGVAGTGLAASPGNRPAVSVRFDEPGAARLAKLTENHLGQTLGIVVDGVLFSAPTIRARIAGQAIIMGRFTIQEVEALAQALRAGMAAVESGGGAGP